MSEEKPEGRAPGCAPLDFGNRLAWRWAPEMPRTLKGGFLTMLYTLRTMASASGALRFADGKPIRIQDIARAAGCREQDARRYLDAGELAGVVAVDGERRRGRANLYVLLLAPCPDWAAAAAHLKVTARPRKAEKDGGSSGHSGMNSDTDEFGPQRHELDGSSGTEGADGVRATVARWGSGHSGTLSSGHSGTNNPGVTQEVPQDVADVVGQQPLRAGEPDVQDHFSPVAENTAPAAPGTGTADAAPAGYQVRECPCGQLIVRPDRDRCAGCIHQERDAEARAERDRAQAEQVRRDIASAAAVFGAAPSRVLAPVPGQGRPVQAAKGQWPGQRPLTMSLLDGGLLEDPAAPAAGDEHDDDGWAVAR